MAYSDFPYPLPKNPRWAPQKQKYPKMMKFTMHVGAKVTSFHEHSCLTSICFPGNFGQVFQGVYIDDQGQRHIVAVKVCQYSLALFLRVFGKSAIQLYIQRDPLSYKANGTFLKSILI